MGDEQSAASESSSVFTAHRSARAFGVQANSEWRAPVCSWSLGVVATAALAAPALFSLKCAIAYDHFVLIRQCAWLLNKYEVARA